VEPFGVKIRSDKEAMQVETQALTKSQKRRRKQQQKKRELEIEMADLPVLLRVDDEEESANGSPNEEEQIDAKDGEKEIESELSNDNDCNNKMQVVTCKKLATFKTNATNAQNRDDYCASCMQQWTNFEDPTIAVILECKHASCANCLMSFYKHCNNNDEEDSTDFTCVLCKARLTPRIFHDIAQEVLRKNLIKSFKLLSSYLHFVMSKEECNELIVSLLINDKFKFDVVKVENALFNILTLLRFDDQGNCLNDALQDFDSKEKQQIYITARTPVQNLHVEYLNLRNDLLACMETDSHDFKAKQKKLAGIYSQMGPFCFFI
jgi:hypothetical protein